MNQELIRTDDSIALLRASQVAVIEAMPADMQGMIHRACQPGLSKCDALATDDELQNYLSRAAALSGTSMDAGDLVLHSMEVREWLLRLYPYVTLPEIEEAIKCGVYGQYGEYFGINAKSVVFFVKEYLQGKTRLRAIERFKEAKIAKPVPKLIASEIMLLIQRDYVKYLQDEYIPFLPANYKLLRKVGLIRLNSSESWYQWMVLATQKRYIPPTQRKDEGDVKSVVDCIVGEIKVKTEMTLSEYHALIANVRRLRYLKFFEVTAKAGIKDIFQELEYIKI
jgi:hypothetical protein